MKQIFVVFIIGVFVGFAIALSDASFTSFFTASPVTLGVAEVTPVFSPGSEDVIVNLMRGARSELDLEVYTLSSQVLQDELKGAAQRGVNVNVILESSIASNVKPFKELQAAGVKVRWASRSFALTHSKFLVVDNETVFVGSNNWSFHSFNLNREASVKIRSVEVSREFLNVFYNDFAKGAAS